MGRSSVVTRDAAMGVVTMTDGIMTGMVMAVVEGPSLGRVLRAGKSDRGEQSSGDLQFHYDVFPSHCERVANLFDFVFTM